MLRSRKTITLVLVIILGISLLLFRQTLASALYQNLGYVLLTRDLLSPTPNRVELSSAQRLFGASLRWQLGNSRSRWGLGLAHHRLGEDGAAVGEWRLGEGALSRLLTMSDAAHKAEEYDQALTHAFLAVQLDPKSSSAHYRLGEAHRALGELDQALAEYERARELNSFLPSDEADMAACYFGEARVYEAQKKWEAAVWLYEAGLQVRPNAAAYAAVGQIYHHQFQELTTAGQYLVQAIALDPTEGWWQVALARVYIDQERYDLALAGLQNASEMAGWGADAAELYVALGRAYGGLGHPEKAAAAYEAALAMDPGNRAAMEGLQRVTGSPNAE